MTSVSILDEDGWQDIGVAVSITMRHVSDDGTLTTPPGTCPQCCTIPLNGEPHVCPHGVTLPR